ncbi:MAG: hypothetical protein NVS9B1_24710 [Candidatus Dormibacteraceae bacterium]
MIGVALTKAGAHNGVRETELASQYAWNNSRARGGISAAGAAMVSRTNRGPGSERGEHLTGLSQKMSQPNRDTGRDVG